MGLNLQCPLSLRLVLPNPNVAICSPATFFSTVNKCCALKDVTVKSLSVYATTVILSLKGFYFAVTLLNSYLCTLIFVGTSYSTNKTYTFHLCFQFNSPVAPESKWPEASVLKLGHYDPRTIVMLSIQTKCFVYQSKMQYTVHVETKNRREAKLSKMKKVCKKLFKFIGQNLAIINLIQK